MRTLSRYSRILFVTVIALAAAGAWAQDPEPAQPASRALPPAEARPGPAARHMLLAGAQEQPHRVEISGVSDANLRIVSSLSAVIDVKRTVAPNNPRIQIQAGRTRYKSIKVRGDLPLRGDMLDWFESVRDGADDRRVGIIVLLRNDMQTEIQRIKFDDALPAALDVDLAGSHWVMTLAVEAIDFSD